MSYQLRPYQEEIVEKAFKDLAVSGEKPVLHSIVCGAGKTWIIAELAKRWREKGLGKVLVLTLSKELCLQDYDKLCLVAGEESVGIYSASWKRKETADITVATAQSAYKHPELWKEYSLVVADECDSLNPDGIAGELYLHKHVYGLTGTAYATVGSRKGKWFTTKLWPLHKIKSKRFGWFWQPISYELSAKQMLEMSYHTPLKIYSKPINCHLLKLQSNGSEYTADSLETWAKATLRRVVEVMQKAEETGMCHCGIVFMPSVESCETLEEECAKRNISAHAVHAKTPDKERLEIITNHKEGKLKWLINMGVATRGFDNPMVDCLVIARATASLRLWNQILGRGVRLAEGKTVCNVLDLTKNSQNMGSITDVEMGKALKNGYACDTILLKGKDISGMEVSKINLQEKKQHANATGARQPRKKGTKSPHRGRNSSEH